MFDNKTSNYRLGYCLKGFHVENIKTNCVDVKPLIKTFTLFYKTGLKLIAGAVYFMRKKGERHGKIKDAANTTGHA